MRTTKLAWNWRSASYLSEQKDIKLVHGFANVNIPITKSASYKKIITVHDIIPLLAPHGVSKSYYWQFKLLLPKVLDGADRIVCVSDWTRRMLEERFPVVASKCVVIKNGTGPLMLNEFQAVESEMIQTLMVSRFEIYKRFDRYCHLLRTHSERLLGTIVTDDRGSQWLHQHAMDLIEQGQLRVLKDISQQELSNCFHSCDVYVHTSSYEGFCLPLNEALVHGRPVVFQIGSGMDEVVPDLLGQGLKASATGDEWFEAIENSYRKRLSNKWLEQVAQAMTAGTSWKNAANSLISLYNQMI